jgi:hypothetical protein
MELKIQGSVDCPLTSLCQLLMLLRHTDHSKQIMETFMLRMSTLSRENESIAQLCKASVTIASYSWRACTVGKSNHVCPSLKLTRTKPPPPPPQKKRNNVTWSGSCPATSKAHMYTGHPVAQWNRKIFHLSHTSYARSNVLLSRCCCAGCWPDNYRCHFDVACYPRHKEQNRRQRLHTAVSLNVIPPSGMGLRNLCSWTIHRKRCPNSGVRNGFNCRFESQRTAHCREATL